MSPSIFASSQPKVKIRFKRCPDCGDITIMSAPVCACCDRTYVTTSRFARQSPYMDLVASLVPTPYLYDHQNDFVVINARSSPKNDPKVTTFNPMAIYAAVGAMAWLGMMINGQKAKGWCALIAFLIWAGIAAVVAREGQLPLLFTCVSGVGGYLVGLVDVICICKRLEQREAVQDWDWF